VSRIEPIGSDFGYPDHRVRQDCPRGLTSMGEIVRSGRQGLTLVARALTHLESVWLPEFHCESMVEPFEAEGFKLRFYPVDYDLWPVADQLVQLHDAVVVFAPYFGRSVPREVSAALEDLSGRNSTP
jgi:hypothetical protein